MAPAGVDRPPPATPKGLQPGAQRRWRKLWVSPVAGLIDLDADGEALERWIHCVSERERLQSLADKTPLVTGSTGQLVANPLYGVIRGLSREIARLEDHFGLTPLGRMRLGFVQTQVDRGRADLLRRLDAIGERRHLHDAQVIDLDGLG